MLSSRRPKRRKASRRWGWGDFLLTALFTVTIVPLALTIAFRYVPPPLTPLMAIRLFEGYGLHKSWTPLNQISPYMPAMVIASEDNLFCRHNGFDWAAINRAVAKWQNGQAHGGASTISQQTAKNIYLWPGQTFLRKGLEVPLTVLIENLWGKRRIMEVYLNIIEFGPGIYGVQAASRAYFHTSAARLTPRQAALLAAILPNPLHWSAKNPGPYIRQRAGIIMHRPYQLGSPMLACAMPPKRR